MLFRSETAVKTWDGWVYYHNGAYYLYYLISEKFVCDGFGVATSQDGVHWQDRGWVLRHSEKMVRYLGGGSIWKDVHFPQTGRFLCNYSEWHMEGDKNVQRIFFAWSDDLLNWGKFEEDAVFGIDERFYRRIEPNARGPWEDPRWDGMCVVPRPEGGYYGYWTATPKDFLGFGFGVSEDGLHWQALEPPRIEWDGEPKMYFIEVGGVHEVDGRYYAMLADYATVNCGMFNFVADAPAGPFRPSARNFGLLRNQSKMHAYFTRFVDTPDGVLVTHHSLAEGQFSDEHYVVYYAPLKRALVIDGTLYLAWWEGNDRLKNREGEINPSAEQIRHETDQGIILEGRLNLPGKIIIHTGEIATGILVNERGITVFGAALHFRLLLHHTMLEFYLEDIFIQCYTMNKASAGTISCQNTNDLKLWQWE
jgi:hypothetical protein